jgi:uncharacterized protein involved in exopolysaccharide biosynthesis
VTTPHGAGRTEVANEYFLPGLLQLLGRYRWLIAACVLTSTGAAVLVAFLMTPVYRSEVTFAPSETESDLASSGLMSQIGGLASLAGVVTDAGSLTEKALAVLKSHAFTAGFILDEGLLPVLFADRWDVATDDWRAGEDIPTVFEAVELFDGIRQVNEDRITGIITLRIDWKDPSLAADWANHLMARLNATLRAHAVEDAQRILDFLRKELQRTSAVELQQAIYRLVEANLNRIMLANVREEYVFDILDPAVPADEDAFVRPNRPLLIAIGISFGLLVGVMLAALLRARVGTDAATASRDA